MRDEKAFETLLHEALNRRGAPAPFSIDVQERVMARVAAIGAPPRTEMGLRQFGRWALAASIVGAALLAAAVWAGPSLADVAAGLGHTVAGTTDAALKLAAPAGSLAGALGRLGSALLASVQTLLRPLSLFQPFAHAILAVIAAAMLGITSFVVGRDLRAHVVD